MMGAREAFETIAELLERADGKGLQPLHIRGLIIQAHTHAILQAAALRRAEAYAERQHVTVLQ